MDKMAELQHCHKMVAWDAARAGRLL